MKRMVSFLLAMVMALSLTACAEQAADRYCASCGHGLAKDVSFCDECGARVSDDEDESAVTDEKSSTTTSSVTKTNKTTAKSSTAKPTVTTTTTTTTKAKPTTTTTAKAPAHTHSYAKAVTPATCTEKGYTTYTCSCGHSYKDNYTDPSHKYESYVCSICGKLDKAHAYEWLIELVKERGTAFSDTIRFDIFGNGDTFLNYTPDDDNLNITYYCTNDYGEFIHCYLDLDSYFYGYSRGTKGTSGYREVYGYLDAKNFTKNSPLNDVHYQGPTTDKYIFLEGARTSILVLVESLNCIAEQSEGLDMTIADLGFTSWK